MRSTVRRDRVPQHRIAETVADETANIEESAVLVDDGVAFTRAERVARARPAATQALVLEPFDDSIVTVSSEQARRAIQSSRTGRAG